MSSNGRHHVPGCRVGRDLGHTNGKWCWTEADIQSLENQHANNKTWNQIADSFKFYDDKGNRTCYRHHSFACQAKMNALQLGDAGKANSHKLANLAKRPTSAKKQAIKRVEKQKLAVLKEQQGHEYNDGGAGGNDDNDDDKEADEAIKKVKVKLEPGSE